MKSPVFVFLGVAESTAITDISLLKSQLEIALGSYIGQLTFEIKEQLLIVRQLNPHFSYYISFANNDHQTLAEWKELAKNFGLPWDIRYSPFHQWGNQPYGTEL
jgi:hypothetical protein